MRKNKKRVSKVLLSFLLCLSLALPVTQSLFATYTSGIGMGTLVFNERREIAKGVFLDNWQGKEASGKPKKGYSITFNPVSSDAKVITSFGDSINSRMTLTRMISGVEKQGYSVIGGINGDFYHLANGVPVGLVIKNGRIVSNNSASSNAIGFKEDGSAVIGSPKVDIRGTVENTEFPIMHLNKAQGEWGPYLYTSDYGPNTGSSVPSFEVVIDITSGDTAPGSKITGVVSAVKTDSKATPIGKNQLVLSAQTGKSGSLILSLLKVGYPVSFSFNIADPNWTGVKEAIGGSTILISKGQINPSLSTSNLNPTTAIGIKSSGEVVFLEVDGRNDAHSIGLTSVDAARFLYEQGCVDALMMDGGGSSTIAARIPGNISPTVLNRPSDGSERANSNGLIIVSKQSMLINSGLAAPTLEARLLHLFPGKALVAPGGTLNFRTTATDDYFFPVANPTGIIWSTTGGAVDSTGQYLAPTQPGTYQIFASSGLATGSTTVQVVNPAEITQITASKTSFTLLPGATQAITMQAFANGVPVASHNALYTWQVEGAIGTITPDGIFTAQPGGSGTGKIKVSLGNATTTINVNLGNDPSVIEDFEVGNGWSATLVRAASGSAAIAENPDTAAFGSKSLKISYDFTLGAGVEKGVAGIYATKSINGVSGIPLEKTPTAIGMWVYGNNSKYWLRARMKDGAGNAFDIDFTKDYRTDTLSGGIDWSGWKYVEAAIPADKQGPFILDLPVRIMCTRDEMRAAGTLYIDRIKAVYGERTDDLILPEATIASPADQSVLKSGKLDFKASVTDNVAVDEKSIKLILDGAAIEGLKITNTNGMIQAETSLGTTVPVADGLHILTLHFSDMFGNKATKTINFTVETGAPQVMSTASATANVGENFNYTVNVKNPNNLKKIYMILQYDKTMMDIVDADPKTKGVQAALEGWVKKGKVVNNKVDTEAGKIYIEVDNLKAASKEKNLKAFQITFKPKTNTIPSSEISLGVGAMIVGTNKSGSRFSLPVSKVEMGFGLMLKAEGTTSGQMTSITVTDKAGKPVEGAGIHYNGMADFFLTTDKSGKAQTKALTDLPVGTAVSIQAKKNGLASNTINFKIGEAVKTPDPVNIPDPVKIGEGGTGLVPQALHLSFDANAGIRFNYLTDVGQIGTTLQIVERSGFNGTFGANAATFKGTDSETVGINVDQPVMIRTHTVSVSGLKPGVSYIYRFMDAHGKVSNTYECLVPNTAAPYTFLFLTDPQATNEATYAVYKDTLEKAYAAAGNPAFAVLTGDMVDRGNQKSQYDMFFNASTKVFTKIPVMMVPGNHEKYDDTTLANYRNYVGLPENGPEGFGESAYSFETQDALFMTLNTQEPLAAQLTWLEQKALSSTKKWKIVMMHRGIYAGFYDESELRRVIAPVFDRAGIDLVLSGHDHTYLRTTMKAGTKTSPGQGTTYITGGSSAKKYYDAEKRSWTEVLYDVNLPVYTILKVQTDRITVVSSHVENGQSVEHDRFDIVKK